jgi:hypothetical protein
VTPYVRIVEERVRHSGLPEFTDWYPQRIEGAVPPAWVDGVGERRLREYIPYEDHRYYALKLRGQAQAGWEQALALARQCGDAAVVAMAEDALGRLTNIEVP